MASLQSLITTISSYYVPDLNSRPAVLEAVDRAVKRLFNNDTSESTYYNYSDPEFPFPILSTTADTLSYDITATYLVDSTGTAIAALTVKGVTVTARKIRRVFISASSKATGQFSPRFQGEMFQLHGINPYWAPRLYYGNYRSIVGDPRPKSNNNNCHFLFMEDPGTHDDLFYVEFYYSHPDLDTETSSVMIDLDKWEQAVIDGAVGYIEDFRHGPPERLNKFDNYWVKKYIAAANEAAIQRSPARIAMRDCG